MSPPTSSTPAVVNVFDGTTTAVWVEADQQAIAVGAAVVPEDLAAGWVGERLTRLTGRQVLFSMDTDGRLLQIVVLSRVSGLDLGIRPVLTLHSAMNLDLPYGHCICAWLPLTRESAPARPDGNVDRPAALRYQVPGGSLVLEAGCGVGAQTIALARLHPLDSRRLISPETRSQKPRAGSGWPG